MKNKLNIGDLLYRSKLLVEHAGIYLGKGKVLHNSPSGNVEICALEEYANGKPVKVVLSHLSEDKKNKRIRPMIPRGDIVSVGSSKAGVHRYQAQISLALSCT
ncbi:hypothetical protein DYL72_11820 [Vibrio anguillarum]|uniref:NlpC/P60 domain-containing protein n=1 Tax=Vibrio anguillarum TaxID=55601 RepID=A0A7U6FQV0_VIBAN|nr:MULTISPECIES: NlpC/P60 family protein [Vibrio]AZS25629.1 hypothetical protein DYL72_11820 [Vibrio anguillarum]UXH27213.1 C40 family peptidase [Vibrio sp. J502]